MLTKCCRFNNAVNILIHQENYKLFRLFIHVVMKEETFILLCLTTTLVVPFGKTYIISSLSVIFIHTKRVYR